MSYIPKELNEAGSDALFLTEILNDLHRHGFVPGGKAYQMLKDWKSDLEEKANYPKTAQRKVHAEIMGAGNWLN